MAYLTEQGAQFHYPNSFDISWSKIEVATILLRSMTSLEEFSAFAMPYPQCEFPIYKGLSVQLSHLSLKGFINGGETNNWEDWLTLVKHSKDTLHTLVLDDTEDIPPNVLKTALQLVSPSLLRLFIGTRAPNLQAILLEELPKFKKLISLRTSLPSAVLEVVSPTIMEVGIAHQTRYYEEVQSDESVLRATLKHAKNLPNLKIIWLPGKSFYWRDAEKEQTELILGELKEKAKAAGLTWTFLTPPMRLGMLPIYGTDEEMYVPFPTL